MTDADLLHAPALEIARLIRSRAVSSAEVTEAHLRQAERLNPVLNAIIQLDADGARAAARAADDATAAGEPAGPLHGLPFTVKDWIETEGLICAAGMSERRDFRPKRDATAVARVRAAGGVLLGKTNVNDGTPVYARPNNPYDLARAPGASSSGDAVAVAAGLSPFGVCSDSGGSIRLPAAWCGVAGIKPSQGRVPRTGHFPRIGDLSDPRTEIGLIARSASDLHPLLAVIAGVDGYDPAVSPVPLGDPADVALPGLRAAVYCDIPEAAAAPGTAAAVRAAAGALAAEGVALSDDRPPRIDEARAITHAYWARPESSAWSEWTPDAPPSTMSSDDVERSLFAWERLRRTFLTWMSSYDLIICPVVADAAPEHRALTDVDALWTLPYSLTGYPVAVVRCGTSPDGLPIAVQLVATRWRDDIAIAAAIAVERALGGWRPPDIAC